MTAARDRPDVTVITVTFNAAALVEACLAGLAGQALGDRTIEVVVVDNASTDGTAELVARTHPEVRVIRSTSNLGFAGGNNLALRRVESPYVILLNNDAVPEPGFVAALVDSMAAADRQVAGLTATVLLAARFRHADAADPLAGQVTGADGSYVHEPDGPITLVNSTGNAISRDGYGFDRGWLTEAGRDSPRSEVFGICGAAAILRMAALHDVGLFDEDFFLYYEDSDLSWRLRLAGYRIEYCARAVVHHVHAASTGEGSDLFRFYDGRNRLLMVTKNASGSLALRIVTRYLLTTASIAVRQSQSPSHVRTRLRVMASTARLLPTMLRKRRAIGRSSRISRGEVERLLVEPPRAATGGYRT